jgi:CheY-like chemotaxis protein
VELRRVLAGEPLEGDEPWPCFGGTLLRAVKLPLRDEQGAVCAALLVLRERSEKGGTRAPLGRRRGGVPPAGAASAGSESAGVRSVERPNRGVLVVEENATVRQLVRTVLSRAGYPVVAVGSGAEALERCRQGPEAFGLVLLECGLPGQAVAPALHRLRTLVPHARVVLTSAGTELEAELGSFVQGLLRKPYDVSQLLAAVATGLGQAGALRADDHLLVGPALDRG